jgi:hypothetical protein
MIDRFLSMMDRVASHPSVRVLHRHVFPATPEAEIGFVERELGLSLPPALRDLYSAANGFQFTWIHRQCETDVRLPASGPLDPFYTDELEVEPTGCINLVPLAVAFRGAARGGRYFDEGVCPFDWFSFYNDVSFDRRRPGMPLLLADGHHDGRYDSFFTDAESYLEFLLFTAGHVEARRSFYKGRTNAGLWLHTPRSYFARYSPPDLGVEAFACALDRDAAQVKT